MSLVPPSDEKLILKTDRLILEPIVASHAKEMIWLLKDPELYKFIPQDPPELKELEKTYTHWSKRISPGGDELWLNWVARLLKSGEVIGHFQVGVKGSSESNIAYTVGLRFQRQGFASEGLRAILSFLNKEMGPKSVKAWIDTRNFASIGLVEKLGMVRCEFIKKADYFKGEDSDEFVYQAFFEGGDEGSAAKKFAE